MMQNDIATWSSVGWGENKIPKPWENVGEWT